jgi:hypothetical protein
MKQSPFKFQGNSSKQVKGAKAAPGSEHDDKGKQAMAPKDLKKAQPKAKTNTSIRTGRPVNAQRPKGKG